jgi:hypothetical protein
MFIDIDQSRLESVHITYYTSRQSIHGQAKTPRRVSQIRRYKCSMYAKRHRKK